MACVDLEKITSVTRKMTLMTLTVEDEGGEENVQSRECVCVGKVDDGIEDDKGMVKTELVKSDEMPNVTE
ncbi:hypothetical protein E4T43_08723 [Aureobasidium subglaciale]|nr:hypothetical protein E4T43_08723 [Aureobasidium subglaciale]